VGEGHEAVTVVCCEGDVGAIYRGEVPFTKDLVDLTSIEKPSTKMMLIVGNPEQVEGPSYIHI
jgi:pyruvate,water dikinase